MMTLGEMLAARFERTDKAILEVMAVVSDDTAKFVAAVSTIADSIKCHQASIMMLADRIKTLEEQAEKEADDANRTEG